MANALIATYENGFLRPSEKLPLDENEQVLVIVVPLVTKPEEQPDHGRIKTMREEAETWLKQQPVDSLREPAAIPSKTEQHLDNQFDASLAAIRDRASRFSQDQIIADVEAAIAQVRAMSPEERTQLETELDQVLATVAADAVALQSTPSRRR